MILPLNTTPDDVLLFYPSKSLQEQVRCWNVRRTNCRVRSSRERSFSRIRRLLDANSSVLIDATQDASRAADAFLQAVGRLGPQAVAVYVESSNEYLEQFVRMRGSLFLLGPLFDDEWNIFFDYFLNPRHHAAKAA